MAQTPWEIINQMKREGHLRNAGSDSAVDAIRHLLHTRREGAVSEERDRGANLVTKPAHELQVVERALQEEQDSLSRRTRDRRFEAEHAAAWREVGIQQRIRAPALPRPLRWTVLGFLASIDFYVFALAIAKDQDVAPTPLEPVFLGGGLLGLVVFIAGLALAHQVKDVVYARQQERLLEEINTGERPVDDRVRVRLVTSNPPWLQLGLTGVIFMLLTVYAGAIRYWEMSAGDNPNVVIFLSLIPLLAVCVELYLYDPSLVDPPRPSMRARQLARKREYWEGVRDQAQVNADQETSRVQALYAEAEALLDVEIQRILTDRAARNGDGDGDHAGDGSDDEPDAPGQRSAVD